MSPVKTLTKNYLKVIKSCIYQKEFKTNQNLHMYIYIYIYIYIYCVDVIVSMKKINQKVNIKR